MTFSGFQFSRRVKRLASSPIHDAAAKSKALRAKGTDILNLAVAVPEVIYTPELEKMAQEAMQHATMQFGAVEGEPEAIQAVLNKFARENSLHYAADQVIICNGGKEVLSDAVQVLVDEGDEVILFAPFWPSYLQFILREGGVPVVVRPERADFRITPAQLEAAITPRSKWFIFNNPQNPCGVVYTQAEIAAFAEVIARHPHVAVIADECFELFSYQPYKLVSFAACPGMLERTFTVNGIGKSYGKPGLRIGYGAGPKTLIDQMKVLQSSGPTHANTPGQAAAAVMLSQVGQAHAPQLVAGLKANRDYIVPALNTIPGIRCHLPESVYFAFPNVSAIGDSGALQLQLLEAGVMCLDGAHCGLPGHLRFAYTQPRALLEKAVERIRTALEKPAKNA